MPLLLHSLALKQCTLGVLLLPGKSLLILTNQLNILVLSHSDCLFDLINDFLLRQVLLVSQQHHDELSSAGFISCLTLTSLCYLLVIHFLMLLTDRALNLLH